MAKNDRKKTSKKEELLSPKKTKNETKPETAEQETAVISKNADTSTTDTVVVDGVDTKKSVDESASILTQKSFQQLGVCEVLCDTCERLEWKTATRIQADVLPEALKGRDIIGLAETGSGKTGAFCIPVLQGILNKPVRGTAALILTPTRELAFQIHTVVQALGQAMGATSVCVVGGVDRTSQAIALARNPHVVIATPGRLVDH
jgi:ATP-dependent RNA helicase DDX47/RRP3